MATIRDIIEQKNLPDGTLIMFRIMTSLPRKKELEDILIGYARYENGTLRPLDGDYYSLDEEIDAYEYVPARDGHEAYLCVYETPGKIEEEAK